MNLAAMGPWAWLIAGVLLGAAETLCPGVFLLWIGLAAMATGLVLFIWPLAFAWTLMLFGALAVASMLIGRKFYGSRVATDSDRPFLNRRADALIGRDFILEQPIRSGEGRIRVHDSVWRVRGADLDQGAKVRVTGVEDGVVLRVEPA